MSDDEVMNDTFADEGTDDPDGNVGVGVIVEDHVDDEVVRNTIADFGTELED